MNIGQMSANDCAVWCMEQDGWVYECGVEGDPVWCKRDSLKKWKPNMDQYPEGSQFACPYPLTIIGANRARPVHWEVSKKDGVWKAKNTKRPSAAEVFVVSCPDDVTALYRIAVMCKLEDQPKSAQINIDQTQQIEQPGQRNTIG